MPAKSTVTSAVDRLLLQRLGERLKRVRSAQRLTTTEVALRAGMSRTTLSAVEAGSPTPTMGSYLNVMGVVGMSHGLALVAGDALSTSSPPDAALRPDSLMLTVSGADHEAQELRSLMLHQEAVRLMKAQPELIEQALETLERWSEAGDPRTRHLWDEWSVILRKRAWRRALALTARGATASKSVAGIFGASR